MGTLVGHAFIGMVFFFIGSWHLFNQMKMFTQKPRSYQCFIWFPCKRLRQLELYLISLGSTFFLLMELFHSPPKHQPLASDGTIPRSHLHNFEHSTVSLAFLVYAVFAMVLDKIRVRSDHSHGGLVQFLGAIALCQELLIFHFHSTDHEGLEGHYHLLLQIVVVISIATTLMGIGYPKCFLISFIRSFSPILQGLWLVVIGVMLNTPRLMPKGCFIDTKEAKEVVSCPDEDELRHAKALVNLEFCWYVTLITIVLVCIYVIMMETCGKNVEYASLTKGSRDVEVQEDNDDDRNIETQEEKSW